MKVLFRFFLPLAGEASSTSSSATYGSSGSNVSPIGSCSGHSSESSEHSSPRSSRWKPFWHTPCSSISWTSQLANVSNPAKHTEQTCVWQRLRRSSKPRRFKKCSCLACSSSSSRLGVTLEHFGMQQ
uniref:(northern house mosquito) hypothetical protein n=1 Tax=Culex pipiens TaxID=7175 RepID=A0A8D8I2A5_CULPI